MKLFFIRRFRRFCSQLSQFITQISQFLFADFTVFVRNLTVFVHCFRSQLRSFYSQILQFSFATLRFSFAVFADFVQFRCSLISLFFSRFLHNYFAACYRILTRFFQFKLLKLNKSKFSNVNFAFSSHFLALGTGQKRSSKRLFATIQILFISQIFTQSFLRRWISVSCHGFFHLSSSFVATVY